MQQRECAFGHLYDADQYGSCPYCNNKSSEYVFGNEKENRTVAPEMFRNQAASAAANAAPNDAGVGKTVAGQDYMNQNRQEEGLGKTTGEFVKKYKFDPVVGWLICTEGPRKGKSYELRSRINTIGRDSTNDISFPSEDSISKKNHLRVAYIALKNNFRVMPGESTNIVYVNGEELLETRALEAYDVIAMGGIKLIFVPLCSEKFTWEQE